MATAETPAAAVPARGPDASVALLGFAALWWAFFAISESPAALQQDMTEAYAWGREFQWGYHQHPPFWAWICGAWFLVFPRAVWAFALLSMVNSTLGLWGSWRLIGRFARGDARVAATALLVLTPFYTFFGYKYNANSIFLSLWPWTLYAYDRAYASLRARDAFGLGLFAAAALLSKYFALILFATIFVSAVLRPGRARYFGSASPYISAAVALALCAPHLVWLLASGAPPLRYLDSVSGLGWLAALNNVQMTFFGCLAGLAAPILVVATLGGATPKPISQALRARAGEPRFRDLCWLAFGPLVISLVVGLILQVKLVTPMLIGVFSLAPLAFIEASGAPDPGRLARVSWRAAAGFSLACALASPLVAYVEALTSTNPRYTEPRQELAAAATRFWREATGRPLLYVGGTPFFDDAIVFYSAEHPHSFADLDLDRNRWVHLTDIDRDGLLTVCRLGDEKCQKAAGALAKPDSRRMQLTLSRHMFGRAMTPATFELTAIAPQSP